MSPRDATWGRTATDDNPVQASGSTAAPSPEDHRPKSPRVARQVTDLDAVQVTDLAVPGTRQQVSDEAALQVTALARLLGLLRYCTVQVTDAAHSAGSHKGGFGDARLESWNQFQTRVQARAWLPDGYDGKFLIVAPAVFYYTVGAAGWAVGHAIVWLCTHMLAFTIAFLLAAAVTVLWLIFG